MAKQGRLLLRTGLELANAANGVRPFGRDGYPTIPAFFLGWPTSEMAPLYLAGSVLGAGVRGWRGDYRGRRGRIALALKVITITQYLRPSARHHPVERWAKPEEFVMLDGVAREIGFLGVLSGPLVRSSSRAGRLHAEAVAATAIH